MRKSDIAWLVMLAAIVLYEAVTEEEELLSEAWDRYLKHDKGKIMAFLTPLFVAGHLNNLLPIWADPISLVFLLKKKLES